MRPAGRQRSVIVPTTPFGSLSESLSRRNGSSQETISTADAAAEEITVEEIVDTELADSTETEVILAPTAFAKAHAAANALERIERHARLADEICQRIRKRLADRVHDLVVRLDGDTIVLEGRCATYYTKQLAQHAALGALEDEHLENAIVVTM